MIRGIPVSGSGITRQASPNVSSTSATVMIADGGPSAAIRPPAITMTVKAPSGIRTDSSSSTIRRS
jgi:hypothetical protein